MVLDFKFILSIYLLEMNYKKKTGDWRLERQVIYLYDNQGAGFDINN